MFTIASHFLLVSCILNTSIFAYASTSALCSFTFSSLLVFSILTFTLFSTNLFFIFLQSSFMFSMTPLWSEFISKPACNREVWTSLLNVFLMSAWSIWVSPWISIMVIMICHSLRGSQSNSMTHLMVEYCVGKYHVMFFGKYKKAPTLFIDHQGRIISNK